MSPPVPANPTPPPPGPTSPDAGGPASSGVELLALEPVPSLLARLRIEVGASFIPGRPTRISRAPGRLDVMGGIADYTGSLVCQAPLDRAAAVAVQGRKDRQVQIFSFDLLDVNRPFTLMLSLDHFARATLAELRTAFNERGRRFAGYLAGGLAILHDEKLIDLADPDLLGVNIAVMSTVPLGAGVSSSAAIEVAAMMNLVEHYAAGLRPWALGLGEDAEAADPALDQGLRPKAQALTPLRLAAMCQRIENELVGSPCGIMDQAACTLGEPGQLMRLVCQPHTLEPPLPLPACVRVIGINSGVRHSVAGGNYGRTRAAAFMGHKIIFDKMRQMGAQVGRELIADPMNGYLANLNLNDYKKFFRPYVPEQFKGGQFLLQHGRTIDRVTTVEPDMIYAVQGATDHHVFEAHRVREFARYLQEAGALDAADSARKLALDKAGHLMYASHISYTRDARLGCDECDVLVDLVRQRESAGFYGAKITGGGSGGTVAVLCDQSATADAAIADILAEYQARTNKTPTAFLAGSPGAWSAGTVVVTA